MWEVVDMEKEEMQTICTDIVPEFDIFITKDELIWGKLKHDNANQNISVQLENLKCISISR